MGGALSRPNLRSCSPPCLAHVWPECKVVQRGASLQLAFLAWQTPALVCRPSPQGRRLPAGCPAPCTGRRSISLPSSQTPRLPSKHLPRTLARGCGRWPNPGTVLSGHFGPLLQPACADLWVKLAEQGTWQISTDRQLHAHSCWGTTLSCRGRPGSAPDSAGHVQESGGQPGAGVPRSVAGVCGAGSPRHPRPCPRGLLQCCRDCWLLHPCRALEPVQPHLPQVRLICPGMLNLQCPVPLHVQPGLLGVPTGPRSRSSRGCGGPCRHPQHTFSRSVRTALPECQHKPAADLARVS